MTPNRQTDKEKRNRKKNSILRFYRIFARQIKKFRRYYERLVQDIVEVRTPLQKIRNPKHSFQPVIQAVEYLLVYSHHSHI